DPGHGEGVGRCAGGRRLPGFGQDGDDHRDQRDEPAAADWCRGKRKGGFRIIVYAGFEEPGGAAGAESRIQVARRGTRPRAPKPALGVLLCPTKYLLSVSQPAILPLAYG